MLAVFVMHGFHKELVFTFCLMLVALAALLLARWTTKNMMIFIFCIATILAFTKAIDVFAEKLFKSTPTYTVQIPYTDQ